MNPFALRLHRKFVPDGELLADLRRVAELLAGRPVTRNAYDAQGRFSGVTLSKRFGCWGNALAAAGLPTTGYAYISDEALFENLAAVWQALGRQPVLEDLHPAAGHSRFSPRTYERRFGSWNAALLRFEGYQDGSDWRSGSRGDARARAAATALEPLLPQIAQRGTPPRTDGARGAGDGDGLTPMRGQPRTAFRAAPASARPAFRAAPTRRSGRKVGWRLRARILLRDHSTCQLCGASPAAVPGTVLHVDHIVPWSNGGETVEGNLRTLCEACNMGRGNWG